MYSEGMPFAISIVKSAIPHAPTIKKQKSIENRSPENSNQPRFNSSITSSSGWIRPHVPRFLHP
jgi:hypothetical protein